MRVRFAREKFNEEAPGFIARRALLLNGVNVAPGDVINTADLSTRRLRQLYDSRKVDMLPAAEVVEEVSEIGEKVKVKKSKPVKIPSDWWKLPVDDLKALAVKISGEQPSSRKEAIKTIKSYVDGFAT